MKVGIVGLGLIGGSVALDIRKKGFADGIIGVEADRANAEAALRIGIADRIAGLEECVSECGLIVVAVPAGAAIELLPLILDMVGERTGDLPAVTDVCSTKSAIVEAVRNHGMRPCYVAAHPMAGTEYSGPWAAMPGLFAGRACIICNREESSPEAIGLVEALYDSLDMRIVYMDAASHDVHTAYVSHISHVTSFALALTVLDKERDEKHIFDLASGGFSSTVRLAKSSPDMWAPILSQNRDNILKVIDTYMAKIGLFREAIETDDMDMMRMLIHDANRIRRILG